MAIDMRAHSKEELAKKPPTAAQLRSLSNFLDKQVELERQAAALAVQAADVQAKLRKLTELDIPGLFEQLGLKEMTLADGRKVTIDDKVYASISEENKPAAFAWLKANNLDGIIKSSIAVEFGRGADSLALKTFQAIQKIVKDQGKLTSKQSVHPSTLSATIREVLAAGKLAIPESITTADVKKSVVKLPK